MTLARSLAMLDLQLMRVGGRKNLLLNGSLSVNQRAFDGTWNNLFNGQYGFDRWKKHALGIEQTVVGGWFDAGTYTLSWVGVGSGFVNGVAVANGGSFLVTDSSLDVAVVVPETAMYIQCENGVQTEFEWTPYSMEMRLCQYYFERITFSAGTYISGAVWASDTTLEAFLPCLEKRVSPTVIFVTPHDSLRAMGGGSINHVFAWTIPTTSTTRFTLTGTVAPTGNAYTGSLLYCKNLVSIDLDSEV